jgi:hypothetical protein
LGAKKPIYLDAQIMRVELMALVYLGKEALEGDLKDVGWYSRMRVDGSIVFEFKIPMKGGYSNG